MVAITIIIMLVI